MVFFRSILKWPLRVLLVAAVPLLGACTGDTLSPAARRAGVAVGQTSLEDAARFTVADAKAALANKTLLRLTPAHGPEVTYTTPDGQYFLWFPGSSVMVGGTWKSEEQDYRKKVRSGGAVREFSGPMTMYCYEFRASAHNPVTGMMGSKTSCEVAGWAKVATVERADGDIFGLAGRSEVPFVLTRDIDSFAQIRARMPGVVAAARPN